MTCITLVMVVLLAGTVSCGAEPAVGGKEGKKAGSRAVLKINDMEYAFRWCPAGTFMMGSPESEEGRNSNETQHRVTLTRGFWMLETPVTQEMWEDVTGENPSNFKGSKRLPVVRISWDDCQEYVKKLNGMGAAPAGYKFSLPTEAQWEYACRAGTTTAYCFGEYSKSKLEEYAWYGGVRDNEEWNTKIVEILKNGKTPPVGEKKSNAWGLCDMHGNVVEWCEDWFGSYPNGNVTDPTGADTGSLRALRGGGWHGSAVDCRSADRHGLNPAYQAGFLGIRLALVRENEKASNPEAARPGESSPIVQDGKKAIDHNTPLEVLQAEAEKGNLDAQCWLAICYESGLHGCNMDIPQAKELYQKVAKHANENLASVQWCKGICYSGGWGVKKDEDEALKWLRKAADQKFAPAQASLGLCYHLGFGVAKDPKEAVKWYRLAAEQENAVAQHGLGVCYCLGFGVEKDTREAVKWYRLAAEQGHVSGRVDLAESYAEGRGVVKDPEEAVKWYRLAAEQGHGKAMHNLGTYYYYGFGVRRDVNQAVYWLRKAVAQGDAQTQRQARITLDNLLYNEFGY